MIHDDECHARLLRFVDAYSAYRAYQRGDESRRAEADEFHEARRKSNQALGEGAATQRSPMTPGYRMLAEAHDRLDCAIEAYEVTLAQQIEDHAPVEMALSAAKSALAKPIWAHLWTRK